MSNLITRFGPALDLAGCHFLSNLGAGMTTAGVGLIASGAGFKPGAVALAGGALATYAARIGCLYDQGGKGPSGGEFCNINMTNVCLVVGKGTAALRGTNSIGFASYGDYQTLLSISCPKYEPSDPDSFGWVSEYRDVTVIFGGDVITTEYIFRRPENGAITLYSEIYQPDQNDVYGECEPIEDPEPWEGKDINDCDITIQMMGMGASPSGDIAPVLLVEYGHQKDKWLELGRDTGIDRGVINPRYGYGYTQTCEFAPVLVWPQPDNPPVFTPIDPGEDLQDALDRLSKQLDERFNALDDELDNILAKLDELLDQTDDPTDPEDPLNIPAGVINFQAFCDKTEAGELEQVTYPLLGATTRNQALTAIYQQNTVLAAMLQQHLNWKTPTCDQKPQKFDGFYRTISFVSTEPSPYGPGRLRKRFKYRSQSGLGLGEVITHWKDFTWTSGPVIVEHSGSALGTPQVWAASIDEGKRVIRHAAGEAGIDPDKVGKWSVSGSDNPRYGVSATMIVATKGGYYWITARDGSEGRPVVGCT